jgi:F420-non-reducing hydrogenase iron-sulfur subunit
MTTGAIIKPSFGESLKDERTAGHRITVFHCCNAIGDTTGQIDDCEVRGINMPCSGMTREVVLLKAFEAGADAVIVMACPEGKCHYLEGNLRARKRVATVKKLLDEIGFDGRRLNFYNISPEDQAAVKGIIEKTASDLATLGPNPAR